jgi:hypothetical protein
MSRDPISFTSNKPNLFHRCPTILKQDQILNGNLNRNYISLNLFGDQSPLHGHNDMLSGFPLLIPNEENDNLMKLGGSLG